MNVKGNRIYTIDCFRLLGALCIILLHIPYAKDMSNIALFLHLGSRWAVPFFFLTSGYFFNVQFESKGNQAIIDVIHKLMLVALIANLIYLPLMIRWRGWESTISIRIFSIGTSLHLWFIHALILSLLLLWLIISTNLKKGLTLLTFFFISFTFLTGAYSFLLGFKSDSEFSMHVAAIALTMIGFKLKTIGIQTRRVSKFLSTSLIIFGYILQFIEATTLEKFNHVNPHDQSFTIGTLFFSLGMFILALRLPIKRNTKFAQYGEKYSLAIYLFHPLIILFLTFQTFPKISFTKTAIFQWISPLIYILICFIFTIIFGKLFTKAIKFLNGK